VFEIGNSLRESRTRRGIEIAQAEQATKIRGKYLRALEEERFDLLPSETYVKGFLRAYAEYLGLDGQLYVDEFNSRFVTEGELSSPRRASSARHSRNRRLETNVVLIALAAIATVTLVVISAWRWAGGDGTSTKPPKKVAAQRAVQAPAPYLTIKAVRGSSYVAVHRGGVAGPVVFEGTIARGETEPFRGKRFWLNVSAPENLVITVGGKRVRVGGYRPRVITVTPAGWQAAS
jgi:hypothetical protein